MSMNNLGNMSHPTTFISYAQNHEDVLLNRVFKDQAEGFYIDIGALHPTADSMTRAFYDKGWSGINIEPIKDYHNIFVQDRTRDINLNIAVSDNSGELEFFQMVNQPANSSLDGEIVYKIAQETGLEFIQYTVSVRTLADICEEYVNHQIDFLKIDVEGFEEQVILGGDWSKFRPTIVMLETTQPNTNIRCENNILPFLQEQNYQHVFFDGVNDYYIALESIHLAQHFAFPVNVLDFYLDYRLIEKQNQINQLVAFINSKAEYNSSDTQYTSQIVQEDKFHIDKHNISINGNNLQKQTHEDTNYNHRIQPIIALDGVFFQLYNTGIARVWESLLEEWVNTEFGNHLVILDRAGTAPKIPGLRYCQIPAYDYDNTDVDRAMLQEVCDGLGAELFISTYYTTPLETPSVFMGYDMIPEVLGFDLNVPMWQEKQRAIQHASAFLTISVQTAKDLIKCYPNLNPQTVHPALCGAQSVFKPAKQSQIESFRTQHGITKPYFLLIGAGSGYKNTILFWQGFAKLANNSDFDIVCTGAGGISAEEYVIYAPNSQVHCVRLDDKDLNLAYVGATALVYPSKYEGFGLPVIEALSSGCPVITCYNGSIPEVAGTSTIYIDDNSIEEMTQALVSVQQTEVRDSLIAAGLIQAQKFSWTKMAKIVKSVLLEQTLAHLQLNEQNLIIFPDWAADEELLGEELGAIFYQLAQHPDAGKITLLIDTSGTADIETANDLISGIAMNLMMNEDLDITESFVISLIGELTSIQWIELLPKLHGKIKLELENIQVIDLAHPHLMDEVKLLDILDLAVA